MSASIANLIYTASSKCLSAGCNDKETDHLVDNLLTVYHVLGIKAAESVAQHITDINPDYTFSSDSSTLKRQIEDWL